MEDIENNNIEENDTKIENTSDKETSEEKAKLKTRSKRTISICFHIVAIVCIAFFACCLTPKTLQNDTFYTLKIGEYIAKNGIGDLTQDMYSMHDLPYTYPHWLYDTLMYYTYVLFGMAGTYGSTMVLAVFLGISVYILCNKKSHNKVLSFAGTIGVLYLIQSLIAARAQLVTFCIFTWEIIFIEDFLKTKNKWLALGLIIFPFLIANLHCAVFPFYFVLALPYIGEYILVSLVDMDLDYKLIKLVNKILYKFTKSEERKEKLNRRFEKIGAGRKRRIEIRKNLRENPYKVRVRRNYIVLLLICIMVIGACTGILNPAGDGAYTYLVKTLQGNTTDSINEHLPVTLAQNIPFATALVLFLMVLIFTDTKIDLYDLFMLAGLTVLAFSSKRQVSMFALFCIPILVKLVAEMVSKYDSKTFEKLEKFIASWFGTIVIVCLFIIIGMKSLVANYRSCYVDDSTYPVQASTWILNNLDVDNLKMYNQYNYGSYLLFRGIPVFIDSRCDLYAPEFNADEENGIEGRDIFTEALNVDGLGIAYEPVFEKYNINYVMLYKNAKLAVELNMDSNYKEVYHDDHFVIFERLSETVGVTQNTK